MRVGRFAGRDGAERRGVALSERSSAGYSGLGMGGTSLVMSVESCAAVAALLLALFGQRRVSEEVPVGCDFVAVEALPVAHDVDYWRHVYVFADG